MSTPMDMNGEKAAEERRGKRIVRWLKVSLWAALLLLVIPMTAALVATVLVTPVLTQVMEQSYGELWFTGWWVSAACLYAYTAYLTAVYWQGQWRDRRKWGWLEEL